jgi:hypothetical protein
VDHVPDSRLLRKSDSAGNRTWDLCVSRPQRWSPLHREMENPGEVFEELIICIRSSLGLFKSSMQRVSLDVLTCSYRYTYMSCRRVLYRLIVAHLGKKSHPTHSQNPDVHDYIHNSTYLEFFFIFPGLGPIKILQLRTDRRTVATSVSRRAAIVPGREICPSEATSAQHSPNTDVT